MAIFLQKSGGGSGGLTEAQANLLYRRIDTANDPFQIPYQGEELTQLDYDGLGDFRDLIDRGNIDSVFPFALPGYGQQQYSVIANDGSTTHIQAEYDLNSLFPGFNFAGNFVTIDPTTSFGGYGIFDKTTTPYTQHIEIGYDKIALGNDGSLFTAVAGGSFEIFGDALGNEVFRIHPSNNYDVEIGNYSISDGPDLLLNAGINSGGRILVSDNGGASLFLVDPNQSGDPKVDIYTQTIRHNNSASNLNLNYGTVFVGDLNNYWHFTTDANENIGFSQSSSATFKQIAGTIQYGANDFVWTDYGGTEVMKLLNSISQLQLANNTTITGISGTDNLNFNIGGTLEIVANDLSIGGNYSLVQTDGTADQVLTTDGAGTTSRQDISNFIQSGDLTETSSNVLVITGGTGAVLGSGTTIEVITDLNQYDNSVSNFISGNGTDNVIPKRSGNDLVDSNIEDNGSQINLNANTQINSAYILPTADGSNNQVITTDGAGNLSFDSLSNLASFIDGTLTATYIPVANGTNTLTDSGIRISGTNYGVDIAPQQKFHIYEATGGVSYRVQAGATHYVDLGTTDNTRANLTSAGGFGLAIGHVGHEEVISVSDDGNLIIGDGPDFDNSVNGQAQVYKVGSTRYTEQTMLNALSYASHVETTTGIGAYIEAFDSYFDGTDWRTSGASGTHPFRRNKSNNTLSLQSFNNSGSAGNVITWSDVLRIGAGAGGAPNKITVGSGTVATSTMKFRLNSDLAISLYHDHSFSGTIGIGDYYITSGVGTTSMTGRKTEMSGASAINVGHEFDITGGTDNTAIKITNADIILDVQTGADIKFDTTTGTKIGTSATEKLALWGATPIEQPTTSIAEAAFVENPGGTVVNVNSTFAGYTLQQMAQALVNLGGLG